MRARLTLISDLADEVTHALIWQSSNIRRPCQLSLKIQYKQYKYSIKFAFQCTERGHTSYNKAVWSLHWVGFSTFSVFVATYLFLQAHFFTEAKVWETAVIKLLLGPVKINSTSSILNKEEILAEYRPQTYFEK